MKSLVKYSILYLLFTLALNLLCYYVSYRAGFVDGARFQYTRTVPTFDYCGQHA